MKWFADGYTFQLGEGGHTERTDFFCDGTEHRARSVKCETATGARTESYKEAGPCGGDCDTWLKKNHGIRPPDVATPEERWT